MLVQIKNPHGQYAPMSVVNMWANCTRLEAVLLTRPEGRAKPEAWTNPTRSPRRAYYFIALLTRWRKVPHIVRHTLNQPHDVRRDSFHDALIFRSV